MTDTIDALNTFYYILENRLEEILNESDVAQIYDVNMSESGLEIYATLTHDDTPIKIHVSCSKELFMHAK